MRVYVAAASSEIERAEWAIAELRKHGIEITEDWPAVMRSNPPDAECSRELLAAACNANVYGIERADCILVLAGPAMSQGRAGELAIAVWIEPDDVFVSGDWRTLGIFGAKVPEDHCFWSSFDPERISPSDRIALNDSYAVAHLIAIAEVWK